MSSETDADDGTAADGGTSGQGADSGAQAGSGGDAGGNSDGGVDGSVDKGADGSVDGGNSDGSNSDGGASDGGYVHTPEGTAEAGASSADDRVALRGEPEPDGFGRKGWALTAVLFTCVLVIPGIIYVYPYAAGAFGFTFFATYLALPLVPALLLGLVAVWSMTAATPNE